MEGQSLKCPVCCNQTFNTKELLLQHLSNILENITCPVCNKKYDSLVQLREHLGQDNCQPSTSITIEFEVEQHENANNATSDSQISDKRKLKNDSAASNSNNNFAVEHSYEAQAGSNEPDKMYVELFSKQLENYRQPCLRTGELKLVKENGESRYVLISQDNELNSENTIVTKQNDDGTISLTSVKAVKKENDSNAIIVSENEMSNSENQGEAYSCNGCNMTFSSVIEHIQTYHNNQEVFLEGSAAEATNPPHTIVFESHDTEDAVEAMSSDHRETPRRVITEAGDIVEEPLIVSPDMVVECVDPLNMEEKEDRIITRQAARLEKSGDKTGPNKGKTNRPYHKVVVKEIIAIKGQPPVKMYQCQSCSVIVADLNDFKAKECNNFRYACAQCPARYDNSKSLCAHMKIHKVKSDEVAESDAVLYECSICNTVFPTNKSLKLHKRMHDPIKSRPVDPPTVNMDGTVVNQKRYRCKICEKLIPVTYRDIHEKSHNSSDKMNCSICNKKFSSASFLEMHMNVHNMGKTPMNAQDKTLPYNCFFCDRRFARPHEKVKHERIHTGEKPHSCEICGKSFRVSYCLTLHMRTHTGARPYACQQCGKRFKAHSVYTHHLLTHSEVRAYKCPFCPKAFKTSVQLAGHKNSHTKPFSCQHCNRPFASLYAVRVHTETHERQNNLKFSCELCGASYARAFALKDHMKQAHKDVQPSSPQPQVTDEEWIIKDIDTGIQDGIQSLNKDLSQEITDLGINTSELIVP